MMDPDPSHAFGLFFMSALLLVLITGLVRFVTAAYLQGKFPKLQVDCFRPSRATAFLMTQPLRSSAACALW